MQPEQNPFAMVHESPLVGGQRLHRRLDVDHKISSILHLTTGSPTLSSYYLVPCLKLSVFVRNKAQSGSQ